MPRHGLPLEVADAGAPVGLVPYALALVVTALAAIATVVLAYPVLPSIAIGGAETPSDVAVALGIGFWVLFGFTGSVRPRAVEGGAVITFHMPFVIAGTILGGPLAGALMGVISLTELREIRRAPWYGVMANHAICVLAAVAGGVAGQLASRAIGEILPAGEALHILMVGLVVGGTFVAMNLLLVIPVVAFRTGAEVGMVLQRSGATLRATLVAELTLGWLMAATYLAVAWWAPLVCVVVILAVWDAHDRREALRRDPMTGLLNDLGFAPLLEDAWEEARRQGRRHAILFIDLDRFGQLNKRYGEDVADEVVKAVAGRLAAAVRSSDVVGRQHRAGDEFLILFRDVPSDEIAERLAWRVHAAILRRVHVRGASLGVEVGASIGIAMLSPGTTEPLERLKRLADERMQAVKRDGGGVRGLEGSADEPDATRPGGLPRHR